MKRALLWAWQLPQNLLGLLVIFVSKAKKHVTNIKGKDYVVWHSCRNWSFGVSLGDYIVLGLRNASAQLTVLHEHGHQKQSLMLGPLYLLAVGLPSVARNIWDRLMHKRWYGDRRNKWYYSGYPEQWADKLGNVKRFE